MIKSKYVINIIILITLIILFFIIKYYTIKLTKKAMVIVEPREHILLKSVIENFHKHMSIDWDLYVFHGKSHKHFAEISTLNIKGRKVHLLPLDTDNLTADEYNYLLRQETFWNKVDAEHILVFQTDTVVCGNSLNKISSFLGYSYVGCPYDDKIVGKHPKWNNGSFYGIGGLSIRKKSFMMECIKNNPNLEEKYPEDVLFSKCVKDKNENIDISTLNNFCTQHIYSKDSFGAHKVNVDLSKKEKNHFYAFCPEAKILEETTSQ